MPDPATSFDAIVVGSGFGGSISACRLAESGRRVLVLERGPRRSGEQFPRLGRAKIHDWLWTSQWNGFWDLREFHRIVTLTSSGVGGGSHAYANVHLRAPERSFREGWPAGTNPETLAPYYERVERMLRVRPFPDDVDIPKRRAYRQVGETIGVKEIQPNLAVYFGEEPAAAMNGSEPAYVDDPHGFGINVRQAPCRHTGECDLGCRFAAKNSVDLNYLAIAEQRHGAEVRPLTEVLAVAPEEGGYRVYFRDRTTFERSSVWAPLAVISAGTVNTNELLLRCRDEYKLLPDLSPALGTHFSGNGDFLCGALNTTEPLDPWRGPVITTSLVYDDDQHFYLQEGGFAPEVSFLVSAMHPDASYLSKLARGPIGHAAQLRVFYSELGKLAQAQQEETLLRELNANAIIFLGMGQDGSDGRVRLHHRLGRRPKLVIDWDHTASLPLIHRMQTEFRRIAHELGGIYVENPLWSRLDRMITVHPLGGAAIADSPEEGVLDPYNQVWGYPNLFVADGAAIPRGLGPNPTLTISAVTERAMSHITQA